MFSPESHLFTAQSKIGQVQMPPLPPEDGSAAPKPNPFAGIRRAGRAKREQNFLKFQQKHDSPEGGEPGAQAGTLFGNVGKQNTKF